MWAWLLTMMPGIDWLRDMTSRSCPKPLQEHDGRALRRHGSTFDFAGDARDARIGLVRRREQISHAREDRLPLHLLDAEHVVASNLDGPHGSTASPLKGGCGDR